jgi:hypothetical protein
MTVARTSHSRCRGLQHSKGGFALHCCPNQAGQGSAGERPLFSFDGGWYGLPVDLRLHFLKHHLRVAPDHGRSNIER